MKREIDNKIDEIFKGVKITKQTRDDWQSYVPKVIDSLRNGRAHWQKFDPSYHKTTNKLYRAIYNAVINYVNRSIKARELAGKAEGATSNNEESYLEKLSSNGEDGDEEDDDVPKSAAAPDISTPVGRDEEEK